MSMQVKPGYVNPLTMMKDHGAGLGGLKKAGKVEEGMKDKVKELQMRQQQLQSEMLLTKAAGTDTGGNTVKKLEKVETKLDEDREELKAARKDYYVKREDNQESAGIYEVKERDGQRIVNIKK